MEIEIKVPTIAYDPKKFGKPWIAKAEFDITSRPIYTHGIWRGLQGKKGMLILNGLQQHDIVAIGIEESPEINWYVIMQHGKLRRLDTKYTAYIHYLMRPAAISEIKKQRGVGGLRP